MWPDVELLIQKRTTALSSMACKVSLSKTAFNSFSRAANGIESLLTIHSRWTRTSLKKI